MRFGVVVLFWAILSIIWAFQKEKSKDPAAYSASSILDYPDEPITADDQDLLGRVIFVDGLSKAIRKLPSHDPFVFGLYGGWGEGKTSVINLLVARVQQDEKLIVIRFNPWYLSSEEGIVPTFYGAIRQGLQERFVLSGFQTLLNRYKDLLNIDASYGWMKLKLPIAGDPAKLRSEIEHWLEGTGCRLLILIDDIDRLQGQAIMTVFKLVALTSKLRSTVFLLSLDPEIVQRLLKSVSNTDPDYLEKIVQKSFHLPPAEQRDIDRFLVFSHPSGQSEQKCGMDELFEELEIEPSRRKEFLEKFSFFYQQSLRPLFRTLRKAKRFLNGLRASLPPIADEIDLFDFILLEIVKSFFPNIYNDVWRNRWIYLPPWTRDGLVSSPIARLDDVEAKRSHIRGHLDKVLEGEEDAAAAAALLRELFPQIKNALGKEWVNYDGVHENYRLRKKLTHPESFPKYYLLRIPGGEMSDAEIEDLIDSWNRASLSDAFFLIKESFGKYRQVGQLGQLLGKLRVFLPRIDGARVPDIVRVIYRAQHKSTSGRPDQSAEEYETEKFFLLRLLEARGQRGEIQSLIHEVVLDCPSLPFIVSLVLSCHREREGGFLRLYSCVDIGGLRSLASTRLKNELIDREKEVDIFEILSETDAHFVLYQWGTDWMTGSENNRQLVRDYVIRLIERRPQYLGRLLYHFLERDFPDRKQVFRIGEFAKIYDPEKMMDLLEKLKKDALLSPAEERAAELFISSVREKSSQPPLEAENKSV